MKQPPPSATYTTLRSGEYFAFKRAPTGALGARTGGAARIRVLPPWWRTWWFMTSCAVLILFSLSAVYRFRLHQLAWQLNMRLEERVGERTRIARELHDTLLQSFQGLMLLFQSVRNLLPDRPIGAVRPCRSFVRADQAIVEGREAVHDLRSSAVENHACPSDHCSRRGTCHL